MVRMAALRARRAGGAGIRCALGGVRGVGRDIAGVVAARDIRGRVLLRHARLPTARKDASETSRSASQERRHPRLLCGARAATGNHVVTRGVAVAALAAEEVSEHATTCGGSTAVAVAVAVAVVSGAARVSSRRLLVSPGVHPTGDSSEAPAHAAANQD